MRKAPEERLQWIKLINRQEDQHLGKFWELRKKSRVCSEHCLNGKPTEAYPYPTENLDYTSTFKQKKEKENFSQTRKYENQKRQKEYTFRNMIFVFKRKPNSCPDHSDSMTANLHKVGMLKIYTFITYYCYNIVHENKNKKLQFKLYLNPINRYSGKLHS